VFLLPQPSRGARSNGVASLRDVVLRYPNADARRLVLAWLDRQVPHWDTVRLHNADDWYFVVREKDESLVTDSALAECAAQVLFGRQHAGLVSAMPSDFMFTPVVAGTRDDSGVIATCELSNHWEESPLRQFLENSISVSNWVELRDFVTQRFSDLVFGEDAFTPLMRVPFSMGLRDRIIALLDVLDRISAEVNTKTGSLSNCGEALREEFFVGGKALFSNSTDSEKCIFASGLTFHCPILGVSKLFPWHGKAKMGDQYRIHFAWPKPDPTQGLPVVYVGPKITKR